MMLAYIHTFLMHNSNDHNEDPKVKCAAVIFVLRGFDWAASCTLDNVSPEPILKYHCCSNRSRKRKKKKELG